MSKSKNWQPTSMNGKIGRNDVNAKNRKSRPSYCYEYVGESKSGYEELFLPIDKMRYKHEHKNQFTLF